MSRMNNCCESVAPHIVESASLSTAISGATVENHMPTCHNPIKLLRLPQVMEMTGLRKTKIYELHAEGAFPQRVKITGHSVGWVEAEVQAWLARRVMSSARATAVTNTER